MTYWAWETHKSLLFRPRHLLLFSLVALQKINNSTCHKRGYLWWCKIFHLIICPIGIKYSSPGSVARYKPHWWWCALRVQSVQANKVLKPSHGSNTKMRCINPLLPHQLQRFQQFPPLYKISMSGHTLKFFSESPMIISFPLELSYLRQGKAYMS